MKPLKASQHSPKFSCHKDFCGEDITILVCHVSLQDSVIKVSFDFKDMSLSR